MKALILSAGGLKGAYDAGVAAALCRQLGNKYFDAIYMTSVGAFAGTFYAANQPDTIENTWRNYVCGNQLVNYFNPLRDRDILDTEYLIEIFKNEKSFLNLDTIFSSGVKLNYVVTNLKTDLVEYLVPTKENIFDVLLAASAMPIAHRPVKINGIEYTDGAIINPLPIQKALDDGHTEIVVIYNKSSDYELSKAKKLRLKLASLLAPLPIRNKMDKMEEIRKSLEKKFDNENIMVIRPSFPIESSILNTNKGVINKLFDLGLKDGDEAAEKILSHML
jgi:predicted patatin/cPLA2 family phospholipase